MQTCILLNTTAWLLNGCLLLGSGRVACRSTFKHILQARTPTASYHKLISSFLMATRLCSAQLKYL